MGRTVGRIKSVNDFLSDTLTAFKDNASLLATKDAFFWVGDLLNAAGQAVAGVNFVIKLYEKWTFGDDPLDVGLTACSEAFRLTAVDTLTHQGKPAITVYEAEGKTFTKNLEITLAKLKMETKPEAKDLEAFSLDSSINHPFYQKAERQFLETTEAMGYDDSERRKMTQRLRARFVPTLLRLIHNRSLENRFKPFATYIAIDHAATQTRLALEYHADLQRRLYEEAPLFNQECFALSDIYIPMDSGIQTWKQLEKKNVDPFLEEYGGIHDLEQTVLDLLGDPTYRDMIVIQGTGGVGKSSFTQHLCGVLLDLGLTPIRIRLRDLDLLNTDPFLKIIQKAIKLEDLSFEDEWSPIPNRHLNSLEEVLESPGVAFGKANIRPYILIFDGWDELSISASVNIQTRIENILTNIREQFLAPGHTLTRVILTGRPSHLVARTGVVEDKTKILTIRPLSPKQLTSLAERLKRALQRKRLPSDPTFIWQPPQEQVFREMIDFYERHYVGWKTNITQKDACLDVLGSPLLAFLTFRLMSDSKKVPKQILENPTLLYQELLDLTCPKSGKPEFANSGTTIKARIDGDTLRRLLQITAVAMFIRGEEKLSYQELKDRITRLFPGWDKKLADAVRESEKSHPLSCLLISYYFKGGNEEMGCEFVHKSFKEYLFAEAVIDMILEFATSNDNSVPRLEPEPYRDYPSDDPRYKLSDDLLRYLAPNWITEEIRNHFLNIIALRVEKAKTDVAARHILEKGRDFLAEIFDWWAGGAHLSLQPLTQKNGDVKYEAPRINDVCKWALPIDGENSKYTPFPINHFDAHFGDSLWQITAAFHQFLGKSEFRPNEEKHSPNQEIQFDGRILFKPRNPNQEGATDLKSLIARINSSGDRPNGDFPQASILIGCSFREKDLSNINFNEATLFCVDLFRANLNGANLFKANLYRANLYRANLYRANLYRANLDDAKLYRANLDDANLDDAKLYRANLYDAKLYRANLSRAKLYRADLSRANLSGANLSGANLDDANLDDANLSRANLSGANLYCANLYSANLYRANLDDANLYRANLYRANLYRANLSGANLSDSELHGAKLTGALLLGKQLDRSMLQEPEFAGAHLKGAILNGEVLTGDENK